MPEPQAPAQEVQPQPRPITFKAGTATDPLGNRSVLIIFQHELGQFIGFVPADFADFIAKTLREEAAKARTGGLIVPEAVLPPGFDPKGNGQGGG
jgi:hypothetical protein